MRVKPLPPSQRENRRYLFFAYESSGPVSATAMDGAVRESSRTLFGDAESASAHLRIIRMDDDCGVLRCNRIHVMLARASLAAVGYAAGERIACRVLNTSGTLKRGMERYMKKKAALTDELEREIVDFGQQIGKKVAVNDVSVNDILESNKLSKRPNSHVVGRTIFDPSGR